jgi:hypothetical protein
MRAIDTQRSSAPATLWVMVAIALLSAATPRVLVASTATCPAGCDMISFGSDRRYFEAPIILPVHTCISSLIFSCLQSYTVLVALFHRRRH